jgi:K+-sensing histidine kinase KdpD
MASSSSIREIVYSAVLVTLASLVTISSRYFLDRVFFVFLLCAVMASALRGGFWIGAFATILSVTSYVTTSVIATLDGPTIAERALVFVAAAAVVTWLAGSRRVALERLSQAISDLQKTMDEVKTLRGLVPICAGCKKIRDDQGYWVEVERYIQERTEAHFTHGMCRECLKRWYPDAYEELFPEAS